MRAKIPRSSVRVALTSFVMAIATCPRCASVVALHEGRPVVTSTGITLWHTRCWNDREVPVSATVVEPSVELVNAALASHSQLSVSRRRTRNKWRVAFGVAAAGAVAACAGLQLSAREAGESIEDVEPTVITANLAFDLQPSLRGTSVEPEAPPPGRWRIEHKIPKDSKGRGYDELYPTIVQWVHPVTAAPEHVPLDSGRHFGADRTGVARNDCGSGHCGIDL